MRHGMVAAVLALGQAVLQQRHPHDRVGGSLSLIAFVTPGSRQGLLHRVAGENPERTRNAGRELRVLDSACSLAAHVVVVIGLTANHRPETGDAREAAGLAAPPGSERQLEGAGDLVRVDRCRADAAVVEALHGAVQQALRELLVEGADADRELQATQDLAIGAGECRPGVLLSHPPARPPARRVPRARPRAVARRGSAPRRAAAPGGGAYGRGDRAWFGGTLRCAGSEWPGSAADR